MINFSYTKPASVASAIDTLARDTNAAFIAGGTNLVDLMKRGVMTPEKLVDINGLSLKSIDEKNNIIRIGALALNSSVAEHDLILEKLPLLARAINAGASPQVRNMATVGGNIMQRTRCPYFYDTTMPCNKRKPGTGCSARQGYNRMHAILGASENCIAVHPSDMCVALTALDAIVLLTGGKSVRRIPFGDFHRLPGTTPEKDNNLRRGELITAVEIPIPKKSAVHYLKIRDRASYAFALVSVAVNLQLNEAGTIIEKASLALGGVAHKPWRSPAAEKYLTGKAPGKEVFKRAAEEIFADAKGYGHNNFKIQLGKNAVVQALTSAMTNGDRN